MPPPSPPFPPPPSCSLDIDRGCDADIADAPLRAFYNGSAVRVLASVDLGSRGFVGPTVDSIRHSCTLYANSTNDMDISLFADHEWVHSSWYFPNNNSVYALTHNEYHCDRPGCPAGFPPPSGYGFVTGVTLMQSLDGGDSWQHSRPPPEHIVAVFPYAWNASIAVNPGYYGFRSPSGIVESRAGDGFFYATVTAAWGPNELGQQAGACMMRTRDLTDPSSWLAWGGSSYNISLSVSPWLNPDLDPAQHRCVPFTNTTYAVMAWSSFYSRYIYFGTNDGNDDAGWHFALADDLANPDWTNWTLVDTAGFITPGGNASIVAPPPGYQMPGRFVMRNTSSDGAIFWEDDAKTVKRPVGACEICPNLNACQTFVRIPDAEFDALANASNFGCTIAGWNGTGTSHYYYPTLVDGSVAQTRPNFDEVGQTATLFLVAQECVNVVGGSGSGGMSCSPFDPNGLLVRDVVKVPISFAGGMRG